MPTPLPADGPEIHPCEGKSARRRRNWKPDRRIAELAADQHGVVTLTQLMAEGVGMGAIDRRVEHGRLHRVHQGVYAVGYPLLTREGRLLAAVLACGPGAVLSHRSAAELWGLQANPSVEIDVTAPNRRGRAPSGISAHRDGALREEDCTSVAGIPCTTVPRALLDVAAVSTIPELRRMVEEAEVKRLLDVAAVRRLIRRCRGRRGVARLRMIIDSIHPDTRRTRSPLERKFLRMCERAMLPRPEVNVSLDIDSIRVEADFLWRDARLIVETDGRETHDTASAFEGDRRRDQRLMLSGWRVIRSTWSQVTGEPGDLARTIRALLAEQA